MTNLKHKMSLKRKTWRPKEESRKQADFLSSVERYGKNMLIFFVPICSMAQKKLASILGLGKVKPIDANSLQMKLKNYTNCNFIYVVNYILHLTVINDDTSHLTIVNYDTSHLTIINYDASHLTIINNNFLRTSSSTTDDC